MIALLDLAQRTAEQNIRAYERYGCDDGGLELAIQKREAARKGIEMAKGRSWGVANEVYANSPLAAERNRNAQLSGLLRRVCGLLRLEANEDRLEDWCRQRELEIREAAQATSKEGEN